MKISATGWQAFPSCINCFKSSSFQTVLESQNKMSSLLISSGHLTFMIDKVVLTWSCKGPITACYLFISVDIFLGIAYCKFSMI